MKHRTLVATLALLILTGSTQATESVAPQGRDDAVISASPAKHAWSAEQEDNICGIATLKRVSKPALVDFEELLEATPQVQEMERDGIDPDSVEGKALRKAARTAITKACEKSRKAAGYCSVWKSISHEDGRSIPDITEDVLERL